MHGGQCGNAPETFCATEDRPSSVRRSAISIMLKNRPAILHDEHGDSTFALGIFCRACAIRWANFGKSMCCKDEINCDEQSVCRYRTRCVARSSFLWGAPAASLSFSAACRKVHRTFIARGYCNALGVAG